MMRLSNLKQRIIVLLVALAMLNFNLVVLPAGAEGCSCEHPDGENGFACFCGNSMEKPHCGTKGPALSRGRCGLDKNGNEFSIPAHEYPSLISSEGADLTLHLSFLNVEDGEIFSNADLLPTERPPSNPWTLYRKV